MDNAQNFTVAVAQTTPVFLDKAATTEKACAIIAKAGEHGAKLVVFPEGFIPAYPDWVWVVPGGDGRTLNDLYAELAANAVSIPDETTRRLCEAAKAAQVFVTIGVNELNREASGASIFNTLLYIGRDGEILGKHRKLMPTAGERTVWAQGDGRTLAVFDTPIGVLGGLLCWENYMPLARQAMYNRGVQIFVAPTWDSSDIWLATLRHVAKEGGMYVIGCCQPVHLS
ncbi:MAG: carbon-nitrogen hydrolase family protein, partial [Chloroflexi bacterium]